MMKSLFRIPRWPWFVAASLLVVLAVVSPVSFIEGKGAGAGAEDGKKIRIAYCETDPYSSYASTLYYIVQGFEKLGWLDQASGLPYKQGQEDTKGMWNWLSSHTGGSRLEFVKDGYYSLQNDDKMAQRVVERLQKEKDIDLIIVMGTAAAKAIANDQHSVSTVVFSTSNAVQSGIVKQVETSGNSHIWAHTDPNRYQQQLEVFYDTFKFKKLGFVYDPSPMGQVFAAVADIKAVAEKKGFQCVGYEIQGAKDDGDQERFQKDLLVLQQKMASEVDAVYYTVTPSKRLKTEKFQEILQPLYEKNIPVFAQVGDEVPRGALLSVGRSDFSGVGMFGAEQIVNVLNGQPMDMLPQVYVDAPAIAINMEVARKIGYKPPFDILLVADKVYQSIER